MRLDGIGTRKDFCDLLTESGQKRLQQGIEPQQAGSDAAQNSRRRLAFQTPGLFFFQPAVERLDFRKDEIQSLIEAAIVQKGSELVLLNRPLSNSAVERKLADGLRASAKRELAGDEPDCRAGRPTRCYKPLSGVHS